MDRGKRASEIVMPVWTDVKDDTIADLGSAKFADEAGFRESNAPDSQECARQPGMQGPYSGRILISLDVPYADRHNWPLDLVSAVLSVYQILWSFAVALLLE